LTQLGEIEQHVPAKTWYAPIAQIEANELLEFMEPLFREHGETGRDCRQRLELVFSWLIIHKRCTFRYGFTVPWAMAEEIPFPSGAPCGSRGRLCKHGRACGRFGGLPLAPLFWNDRERDHLLRRFAPGFYTLPYSYCEREPIEGNLPGGPLKEQFRLDVRRPVRRACEYTYTALSRDTGYGIEDRIGTAHILAAAKLLSMQPPIRQELSGSRWQVNARSPSSTTSTTRTPMISETRVEYDYCYVEQLRAWLSEWL